MPYQVTATRRRPKTFDELAGQEFVSSTLKASLKNGRIAHAYLFSGPRGCGKTTTARILAKALNCDHGPTPEPCGVCDHCQEIARSASLDVIEIDGASNNGVDNIRAIKDEVLFPPNSSRYKVYIIDEVHMLSKGAFNALLKTVEEPPPYVVFIFATTELQEVPATIRSRCQQFNFKLIPIETIAKILRGVCEETGLKAEDEALFWVAKESTGSLRDAYTLFDQVAAFSDGFLRADVIREKLGLAGLDNLNMLTDLCVDGNGEAALLKLDEILGAGAAPQRLTLDLAAFFRSLLFLKAGVTKEGILGYPADRFSQKALSSLSLPKIERGLEIILDLHRDLRYCVSPRFELEAALTKLCGLRFYVSSEDLAAEVEQLKAALGGGEKATEQKPRDVPASVTPELIRDAFEGEFI
jgi:DNA polymerase-3 subunit gamma/tau